MCGSAVSSRLFEAAPSGPPAGNFRTASCCLIALCDPFDLLGRANSFMSHGRKSSSQPTASSPRGFPATRPIFLSGRRDGGGAGKMMEGMDYAFPSSERTDPVSHLMFKAEEQPTMVPRCIFRFLHMNLLHFFAQPSRTPTHIPEAGAEGRCPGDGRSRSVVGGDRGGQNPGAHARKRHHGAAESQPDQAAVGAR